MVRRELVAALADACDRMLNGDGAGVVLQGEHGIGKTTLLDAACASLQTGEVDVTRATCDPLERCVRPRLHLAYPS